jgi:hypothetical protein
MLPLEMPESTPTTTPISNNGPEVDVSTYPPDNISVADGVWGTDFDQDTAVVNSGAYSIRFKNTTPAADPYAYVTRLLETSPGDVWVGDWVVGVDSIAAGNTVTAFVSWHTADGAFLSNSTVFATSVLPGTIGGAAPYTFYVLSGSATAPATAAFVRPVFLKNNTAFNAYLDTMGIRKVQPGCFVSLTSDQSSSSGDVVLFGEEVYDYGDLYDAANHKIVIPSDGPYSVTSGLAIKLLDANEVFQVQLNRKIIGGTDGAYVWGARQHSPINDDTEFASLAFAGAFLRGDELQIRAVHGHGSALNIAGKLTGTHTTYRSWLAVTKL